MMCRRWRTGASGSGRTTFVNTLCESIVSEHNGPDDPARAHVEQGIRIKPINVGGSPVSHSSEVQVLTPRWPRACRARGGGHPYRPDDRRHTGLWRQHRQRVLVRALGPSRSGFRADVQDGLFDSPSPRLLSASKRSRATSSGSTTRSLPRNRASSATRARGTTACTRCSTSSRRRGMRGSRCGSGVDESSIAHQATILGIGSARWTSSSCAGCPRASMSFRSLASRTRSRRRSCATSRRGCVCVELARCSLS